MEIIAQEGAENVISGLWGDAMAVMPVGKGAGKLEVTEVVIPGEFIDLGVPFEAYGRERDRTEAKKDMAAWACYWRAASVRWAGWRRG